KTVVAWLEVLELATGSTFTKGEEWDATIQKAEHETVCGGTRRGGDVGPGDGDHLPRRSAGRFRDRRSGHAGAHPAHECRLRGLPQQREHRSEQLRLAV